MGRVAGRYRNRGRSHRYDAVSRRPDIPPDLAPAHHHPARGAHIPAPRLPFPPPTAETHLSPPPTHTRLIPSRDHHPTRLNGLKRKSMAPQDFRQKGADIQGFAATPYNAREIGRVKELAEMIFDDAAFLGGVERIVTFRPKTKKSDGDAYLKELTHHIKASKETFKMMNTKKDQLVDACANLETELVAEMDTAVGAAEASAASMANQLASQAAATNANTQGTAMATAEERAELEAEKRRVQSQNTLLEENLRRIEEQEAQLQLGIDQLEQERAQIRDEEHQKLKASLSKREADLEQRIVAAEKAEAAAARAQDHLAEEKKSASHAEAAAAEAAALNESLRGELAEVKAELSALTFAKDSDAAAFEASRAETEALSADLRAQIANLESAASDAAARVEELGASAEAAAQQAQAEMDSLRAQMMHAKDEALNMLEDNFGDEIKRKEEEIAAEWAEIMQRKLEEQSHEHKQETKQRESVHLEQLREARETAAKASADSAATLAAVKERAAAREAQLQSENAGALPRTLPSG